MKEEKLAPEQKIVVDEITRQQHPLGAQTIAAFLIFRANKSTLSAPKKTGKVKCLI